jgi:D-lactate dehydrogenase (cytochrome)
LRHRIKARRPRDAAAPTIDRDPAVLASFLNDAAHVPGGFAAGVGFPTNEAEVSALVREARRVLPVGAQSSLTGGATPRGEIVLSTRALKAIGTPAAGRVRVGAGVPLAELQRTLAEAALYYPPVPTFDGAFSGGTIATNAAGAATFKYGAVRRWVSGLVVVLASGEVLDIARGETIASATFEIERTSGEIVVVPVPTYTMPRVAKLSAGYYASAPMDLIDLFVGSEGTLGVVVEATLDVIPRPRRGVALVRCLDDAQAIAVTTALRAGAHEAWQGRGSLDVSAIEYMDARALRAVPDDAFTRAGVGRADGTGVFLLVQIEMRDDDQALEAFLSTLASCGVTADPHMAPPGDDRSARRLFDLREAVPSAVNAHVAATKKTVHPDIEKTAGDMVVPFEHLAESLELYRRVFERRRLDYAVWGHVSDGNLHPNVIPHSLDDVIRGREAILEIADGVIALGGAPLAEHGVGRSAMKQRLLRQLYGERGIVEMQAVKRALDPEWKLAPGVLFPAPGGDARQ